MNMRHINMHAVLEAIEWMEGALSPDFTGAHDLYLDPGLDEKSKPYVLISVSGRGGVEKLSDLFGDHIVLERPERDDVKVQLFIRPLEPAAGMN